MIISLKFKALYCLIIIICVSAIYGNGINGDFAFDDFQNIVANKSIQIDTISLANLKKAAFSTKSGLLRRPISMLSFASNYYLFGLNPLPFKIINILIHLLSSMVLFFLSKQILWHLKRLQPSIALGENTVNIVCYLTMFIWALHPLNLSSVLYVVQRMTSLSAFFSFSAIFLYLYGRKIHIIGASSRGWIYIFISILILIPLSVLSKENGILSIPLIGMCEILLVRFASCRPPNQIRIKIFFILTCILPLILALGYVFFYNGTFLGGYAERDFSLAQRVLTEFRVLMLYIKLTFLPALSELTLFHDDITISKGLFSPVTTILSIISIGALFIIGILQRNKHPVLLFAILFFFIGHSLESTILPLEIAHEHRNYLPIFGFIFASMYCVGILFENKRFKIAVIIPAVVLIYFGTITFYRATIWNNPINHAFHMTENHPKSIRSLYEYSRITYLYFLDEKEPDRKKALEQHVRILLQKCLELDSNNIGAMLGIVQIDAFSKKNTSKLLLADLYNNLTNKQVTAFMSLSVKQLNKCQLNKDCPVDGKIMDEILKSILANKTLSKSRKASVLTQLSLRYLSYNDITSTIELAQMAMNTYPVEIKHWLNYIGLLIDTGNYEIAQNVLHNAKKRFSSEEDRSSLDVLQRKLDKI